MKYALYLLVATIIISTLFVRYSKPDPIAAMLDEEFGYQASAYALSRCQGWESFQFKKDGAGIDIVEFVESKNETETMGIIIRKDRLIEELRKCRRN